MLRGIWGDPERYKETYWSRFDGRYFAGDGAKLDDDGYMWLLGRVDDVMNVSGHRISTTEVESALVDHPAVAEAAVVGANDAITGQAIIALRHAAQRQRGRRGARRRAARPRREEDRPDRPKPKTIVFTADLPKTRSGKIMRRLLRDVAEGRALGDTTTLADAARRRRDRAGAPRPRRPRTEHRVTSDNWLWRAEPVAPGPRSSSTSTACCPTPTAASTTSKGPRRDWRAFFEACGEDPLIEEVGRLLLAARRSLPIVLLTARPLRVQAQTLGWLERYDLRWDLLIMRDHGDYDYAEDFKHFSVQTLKARGIDLVLGLRRRPTQCDDASGQRRALCLPTLRLLRLTQPRGRDMSTCVNNVLYDSARWDGFTIRDGDIIISTPAKCGTTWTQRIIVALDLRHDRSSRANGHISPWLDMNTRPLADVVAELEAQTHRRFIKSHLSYRAVAPGRPSHLHHGRSRPARRRASRWTHHIANVDIGAFLTERAAAVGLEDLAGMAPRRFSDRRTSHRSTRFWRWMEADNEQEMGAERRRPSHGQFLGTARGSERRAAALRATCRSISSARWRTSPNGSGIDAVAGATRGTRAGGVIRNDEGVGRAHRAERRQGFWKSTTDFFHKGTSGQWRDVVTEDEMRSLHKRINALADTRLRALAAQRRLAANPQQPAIERDSNRQYRRGMSKNTIKTYVLLAGLGCFLVFIGQLARRFQRRHARHVPRPRFCGGSYWFSDKLAINAARAVPADEAEMPEYFAHRPRARRRRPACRCRSSTCRPTCSPTRSPPAATRSTRRSRSRRASCRCATGTSCAAFSRTRSATSATATSSSVRSPPRSPPASCSSRASRCSSAAATTTIAPNPIVAHRADDPGAGRRDVDPDGDHPQPRVRGRPHRRPAHRRRRTAGPRAGQARGRRRSRCRWTSTPAQATLFIINPLTGRKVQAANWFRTHPPTEDRIARLRGGEWRELTPQTGRCWAIGQSCN